MPLLTLDSFDSVFAVLASGGSSMFSILVVSGDMSYVGLYNVRTSPIIRAVGIMTAKFLFLPSVHGVT